MKTLAVAIPTYRRPALLERCVLSALASAEGRPLRIVVADDAMNETNLETMTRLCEAHPAVQWHRNLRNLGIDDNIQQAVDLCETDFAWLIGEDDVFLPGAVAAMHDRLQTLDAAFVFANYRYVDDSMQRVLGTALAPAPGVAVPRDDFIARHLWAVGFIGACVLRKSSWDRTDATPYHGTYYTHVGRIAEMLARAESVAVVAQPCVSNRVEGQDAFTWKKDSYGVYFGFVTMCRRVGERVPALTPVMEQARQGFEQRFRWLSLRLAMRLRSEHAYDHAQFTKYLRHSPVGGLKRLMLQAISVAPPGLFQPLVRMYRATRG